MGSKPPRNPDQFPANPPGDLGRVVQNNRRSHNHVKGVVGKWQLFAAAQDQEGVVSVSQILASPPQLGRAEVDSNEANVGPSAERAQELAVSAPNFEDRPWLV